MLEDLDPGPSALVGEMRSTSVLAFEGADRAFPPSEIVTAEDAPERVSPVPYSA